MYLSLPSLLLYNSISTKLINYFFLFPIHHHHHRRLLIAGGDVLLDGAHFQRIPREGITIATWIKLDTNKGIQSIFDTVGSHSRHSDGQYHFEIENAKVRWFHRNEDHNTIFSLETRPLMREGEWTQITATYNAKRQRARVSGSRVTGVHNPERATSMRSCYGLFDGQFILERFWREF